MIFCVPTPWRWDVENVDGVDCGECHWHVVDTTLKQRHWIPAFAGMTIGNATGEELDSALQHALKNPNYPKATSSVIITAKPSITPAVAMWELPPRWDSGMTSSATTKIMAPAAKLNA